MEIPYKKGRLVTEPVLCPDGNHLKMRWWPASDENGQKILGVEVNKSDNPKQFLGSNCWYSLEDLIKLGEGDIHEGINQVGQVWYGTPERDIYRRPLNVEITE